MEGFHIYKHKYEGEVRQYFVAKGQRVYFEIPKWLGRLLTNKCQQKGNFRNGRLH